MESIKLIDAERKRQIEEEGWTAEHDAHHSDLALAVAGAAYAIHCASIHSGEGEEWKKQYNTIGTKIFPFDEEWFKPTPNDPIRQLVKAGALIAAEIDRLLAKEKKNGQG